MLAVPISVLKPSIQMLLIAAVWAAMSHTAIGAEQRPTRPDAAAQSEKPADTKPAAKDAAPPLCDVECIKKTTDAAGQACAPLIEAKAPLDYDWLARPFGGIFQQAEPSSTDTSLVRYRGDAIRFLTPQNQWTRVSYECGYDVAKAAATFVNVRIGRLDRSTTAAVERTNDPAPERNQQRQPPQQPQSVGQRGPTPQGNLQSNLAAGQPAATSAKPPARYGEPSVIDISQVPARR
jgi:hypothetical protein